MGDPDISMATTDGLLDVLINKSSTPVENQKFLKVWHSFEFNNKNTNAL
jgi:hypothetical protein